jgi:hypothetical protein
LLLDPSGSTRIRHVELFRRRPKAALVDPGTASGLRGSAAASPAGTGSHPDPGEILAVSAASVEAAGHKKIDSATIAALAVARFVEKV